jgi:hypothetical protein
LLEIVHYYQAGPWRGKDPFEPQKVVALEEGLDPLARFFETLPGRQDLTRALMRWQSRSLWGNRIDLSNITVETPHDPNEEDERALLLIDHRPAVCELIASGLDRVDLVADNCGLELLADLGWIDVMLSEQLVGQVHVHVKSQPYFVSDAMAKDVEMSVQAFSGAESSALRALAARLGQHRADERLFIDSHPFWTSWHHFDAFPPDLARSLGASDLILFKGDANYRRLVEDRHWPKTTPLEQITPYVPSPFVTLRTLKSEVVVGLKDGMAEELSAREEDWMINGRHGVIHLVDRGEK